MVYKNPHVVMLYICMTDSENT